MPKKILLRTLTASLMAAGTCSSALANSAGTSTLSGASGSSEICAGTSKSESGINQASDTKGSADECCPGATQGTMSERIKSAQSILDDVQNLRTSMREFHRKANEVIAQSKKLQGQAEVMLTKTPMLPAAAKLSPSEYQSALKQYNGDLTNFATHAGAYDQHLKTFQATVGECHANEKALNSVIQKYEIHADQFHMPSLPSTLRPPHICGHMKGGVGQIASEANSMMMDQKRILEAQMALAKTEATLQNAEGEATGTHLKAMNEAKREEGEQSLAGEFSRLKDEYDLLKIEKERLAGNKTGLGKVARSSVSAQVKKK